MLFIDFLLVKKSSSVFIAHQSPISVAVGPVFVGYINFNPNRNGRLNITKKYLYVKQARTVINEKCMNDICMAFTLA